jgi:hypothetical protein
VARKGASVNGPPVRASYWTTPGGLSASDQIALDGLAGKWASAYDVGYGAGEYWAFRLIGGPLLAAGTLGGLDSAIRADYVRGQQAAGYPR